MKKGFFSTSEGKLGAAMLVLLLALPVNVISLNAGFKAGSVIGTLMICAAMAYPPVKTFLKK